MFPALFTLVGYLFGSFPSGVVIGRLVGRDPRKSGSGNIGATNVARAMGKKWGIITLVLDALKGAIPTIIALQVDDVATAVLAAGGAVIGHCYPVWLRFKGGKGVATAFGTYLVFMPGIAAVGVVVFAFVIFITRIPALGSLIGAAVVVPLSRAAGAPFEVQAYGILVLLLLLVRHQSNLRTLKKRYLKNAERRARRARARGVKSSKKKRRRR